MEGTTVTLAGGQTLKLRRVAQMLLMGATRAGTPPAPPLETVQTADGEQQVANESHPAYLAALDRYEADQNLMRMRVMLKWGLDLTLNEEQEADLTEVLADLAASGEDVSWVKTARDRRAAYALYFLLTDMLDYRTVAGAIAGLSVPTEAGIAAAADGFRGDVAGD